MLLYANVSSVLQTYAFTHTYSLQRQLPEMGSILWKGQKWNALSHSTFSIFQIHLGSMGSWYLGITCSVDCSGAELFEWEYACSLTHISNLQLEKWRVREVKRWGRWATLSSGVPVPLLDWCAIETQSENGWSRSLLLLVMRTLSTGMLWVPS